MGTIRKRGDKWSYRVDLGAVNGKRVQKEKGGFATKKEAAAAMTLVENELLKTGEYIEAEQMNSRYLCGLINIVATPIQHKKRRTLSRTSES